MPSLLSNFDKTKTVKGAYARIDFTPAGGVLTKLSCKIIDADGKLTTVMLKEPGADGILRNVDDVPVEATEKLTAVDVEEIDSILTIMGGITGHLKGTATAYIRDPRDADGVVKYKTNTFACSVKRADGAIRMGGADFSKTSLDFENLSGAKITFTTAAVAPDA
jgi:hypothetical protein